MSDDRDSIDEARVIADDSDPQQSDLVNPDAKRAESQGETGAHLFMGGASPYAPDDDRSNLSDRDRDPGARSPSTTTDPTATGPRSALPLGQLDALPHDDRQRAAKRRGLEWPSTDQARQDLADAVREVIRHEDDRVVDAPTALGKSHMVATERWGARDDVTGGHPVVHLSETRDARDEAIDAARGCGGSHFVMLGRHEACSVAAGDHDPHDGPDENGDDRVVVTMDGQPASEWLDERCDDRGIPFSVAHRILERENDQDVTLPCCRRDTIPPQVAHLDVDPAPSQCWAITQWDRWRDGDWPLVFATHNFAHVPGLRHHRNVVIDERPDYQQELGDTINAQTQRVRRAVSAYLSAIDAPVTTWEAFIGLSRYTGGGDAGAERDALQDAIDRRSGQPDREWFVDHPDAHILAPALARAIFSAEERSNGRRGGKCPYEPPRLDATARDDDGWNREWLTVVLDDDNDVRTIRLCPDFGAARSVVGLDAHPSLPVWQANSVPWIQDRRVLGGDARRLWRRYERGLRVVQVGDATRPLAGGNYFDAQGTRSLIDHLRERYGDDFSTGITAKAVEHRLGNIFRNAGIADTTADADTMHYGAEKSRNDFAGEPVGVVLGCIDPGDDYVVDLLAELDMDARPERSEHDCPECEGDGCHECDGIGAKRAHGRGFVGDDAATAQAILASVRESHTAQAAGRYARDADDPDATATVFVRTDAMPAGFADVQVPGVEWTFGEKQQAIVDHLRSAARPQSAHDIALAVDCSRQHVRDTLDRLDHSDDLDRTSSIQVFEGAGTHGATLYSADGMPNSGVVELGAIANSHVWELYTYQLTIRDPDRVDRRDQPPRVSDASSVPDNWWTRDPTGGGGGG